MGANRAIKLGKAAGISGMLVERVVFCGRIVVEVEILWLKWHEQVNKGMIRMRLRRGDSGGSWQQEFHELSGTEKR